MIPKGEFAGLMYLRPMDRKAGTVPHWQEKLVAWLRDPRLQFSVLLGLFLILVGVFAKRRLIDLLPLIPVALFALMIAIRDFRHVWMIGVFCLPLSMELAQFIPGAALTFPTDLVALALMGIVGMKAAAEKQYRFPQFRHPLFPFLLLYLGWIFVTAITSTLPVVSFKWFAATTWVVGGFWFVSSILFHRAKLMYLFVTLIGIAFAIAVSGIFIKYAIQGRNIFGLRVNPTPFFRDHTVFGTFPTLFIPFFFLFTFSKHLNRNFRLMSGILLAYMVAGLFFSYSRGAWASSFLSVVLMGLFLKRDLIRRMMVPLIILAFIGGAFVLPSILESAKRNKAVSRKDFAQHIASITNFRTDESNSERLNRWKCAEQMFDRHPITGYGPGTYAFQYAAFQLAKLRTLESTNHGDIGTAHNEFLLALSEQGLMGGLLALGLFILPLFLGFRGYLRCSIPHLKTLYLGATFGLLAYFMHAFVNNFLDQDKIGIPFYVYLAMITALDVYHKRLKRTEPAH